MLNRMFLGFTAAVASLFTIASASLQAQSQQQAMSFVQGSPLPYSLLDNRLSNRL
ncbi:hypothetical protein [Psychrobacter pygoscelis]|uniref:hypothetical protein n=1 Tax=Psychrobacter pygoscelis TaxID=2488563 RepID=UPI0013F3E330|nr:hypothetical protein [Psychrobacter pygoscelis]